jgi:hypothetical protein
MKAPILTIGYSGIAWVAPLYYQQLHKYLGPHRSHLLSDVNLVPDDPLVEFHRPPGSGVWEASEFVPGLHWFMQRCQHQFIIMHMLDYLLLGPANLGPLDDIVAYMEAHPEVLRADISSDYSAIPYSVHTERYRSLNIFECPPDRKGCFLPSSLCPAVWNVNLLRELMPRHGNPWSFERHLEQSYLQRPELRSIIATPELFQYVNMCRGRDQNRICMATSIYDEVKHMIPAHIGIDLTPKNPMPNHEEILRQYLTC